MIPSAKDLEDRSEDLGDGWVRMPFSDWHFAMTMLRFLERIEKVFSNPWVRGE